MEYELKEYSKEYQDKLIELLLEICVKEYGMKHYEEALIEHVKNEKVEKRLILLDSDEIIATICYVKVDEETAEIKKVYIKKEYRKQRIGTKLVKKMIEYIKDNKYKNICVGTTDHFGGARLFYEKLGFKFKSYEEDGYILEMQVGGMKNAI